jgi:hypothetical protein
VTLSAKALEMTMDGCDNWDYDASLHSVTTVTAWNGLTSTNCLCFNVTNAGSEAVPIPTLHQIVCATITRNTDIIEWRTDDSALATCPLATASGPTIRYINMRRGGGSEDKCFGKTADSSKLIDPRDICLGTLDPVTDKWRCLEGRNERIRYPTWDDNAPRPRHRLAGRISSCSKYQVYAFVNIALPPEPQPDLEELSWWELWGKIVLIVSGSVLFFMLVSAYVLWRLKRYRTKYFAKKEQLEDLQDRARELDEVSGGLGIADDDVDMVANPLVVEMQSLEKQVNKIKDDMNKETEDNKAIDELEKERQKLFAEMERVKAALREAADRARAARVSVTSGVSPLSTSVMANANPLSSMGSNNDDPFAAPTSVGRATISASTVTGQPARSDFTAGTRPKKKKDLD